MNKEKPEKKVRKISILLRFIIIISVILILSISLVTFIEINRHEKDMVEHLINEKIALNNIIAHGTETALMSFNPEFLKTITHKVTESEDVVYSRIVKESGEIYMSNNKGEWGKTIKDYGVRVQEITIIDDYYNDEDIKVVITPINVGNQKYTIWLGFSVKSVEMMNKNIIKETIKITLIIVIVTIIILFFVMRQLINPIKILNIGAQEIGKGNLDYKIKIKSSDEIGELAASFNKMTIDLSESRKAIEEHSKKLEKEVEERTKKVKEDMKELENSRTATLNIMEDLNEAFEKLKELDKLKTEFLTVSSHELRTPITPLKIQIQLALMGKLGKVPKKMEDSLNMMLKNIDQFNFLVGDILDISKIESGAMKFNIVESDIPSILFTSIETLRAKADEKKIKIKTNIGKLPKIKADKERILQVVNNFINNAIKFTDKNGLITIKAIKRKEDILISVKDTGIGMKKDELEKVFTPFVQADSSRSRKYEGTGLGLAICKGIIKYHGGRIWVNSDYGKGSVFYFTLPLRYVPIKEETSVELFGFDSETSKI